jgi:hypothetical protein
VDNIFVPDFPDFGNFMYLDRDSFGGSIYSKTSCVSNCTSKGFSCDIFDKHSQPEYASIEIIYMSQFHCNISITVHLGVIK